MASQSFFCFEGERELLTKEITEKLTKSLEDESALKKITHVKLSNKSFDLESAEFIAEKLKKMDNVEIADLSDIISGRPEDEALQVLKVITDALAGKPIVELHLSDNALGKKGVTFCALLFSSLSKLEKLYMNNNGLAPEAVEMLANTLLTNSPTKLTVLHMFNNLLRDEGAVHISRVVAQSPALKDIRVSATRFSDPGGAAITKSLANARHLTSLDLSDNSLGEETVVQQLVDLLGSQSDLKHLNLRYTELGDDGVTQVLETLRTKNIQLEFLDLSGNDITVGVAKDVADYLSEAKELRKFLMEENELESKGLRAIAKGVRVSSSLEELDFSTNTSKSSGALFLVVSLAGKSQFKQLRLNGNEFSEKGIQFLNSILEILNLSEVLGELGENEEIEEDEDDLNVFNRLTATELEKEFAFVTEEVAMEKAEEEFVQWLQTLRAKVSAKETAELEAQLTKLTVKEK